jgi:hypothetical protein
MSQKSAPNPPCTSEFSLQEIQLLRSYFSDHQWAEGRKALDHVLKHAF